MNESENLNVKFWLSKDFNFRFEYPNKVSQYQGRIQEFCLGEGGAAWIFFFRGMEFGGSLKAPSGVLGSKAPGSSLLLQILGFHR